MRSRQRSKDFESRRSSLPVQGSIRKIQRPETRPYNPTDSWKEQENCDDTWKGGNKQPVNIYSFYFGSSPVGDVEQTSQKRHSLFSQTTSAFPE